MTLKLYKLKSFIGEGPKYTFRPRYEVDGTTKGKRALTAYRKKSLPGPGAYNINDSQKDPSYTMGYRRMYKELKKEDEKPEFDKKLQGIPRKEAVQNGKFSVEQRNNLVISKDALNTPSPWKYRVDSRGWESQGPKYQFSTSSRGIGYGPATISKAYRPWTPGPGTYEFHTTIGYDTPVFSIPREKYQRYSCKNMDNPEPWKYSDVYYRPDTAVYSMSKTNRHDTTKWRVKDNYPPPDFYNPNHSASSKKNTNPLWKFGTSDREYNKKLSKNPGPGHYSYSNDAVPQGPKYTMRIRTKGIKSLIVPGPGKYNTLDGDRIWRDNKWFTFNKEVRPDIMKIAKKKQIPGPGEYQWTDAKCTRDITFPKSLDSDVINEIRKKNIGKYKIQCLVGPGSYKIPCSFDDINNMTRAGGSFDPKYKYV